MRSRTVIKILWWIWVFLIVITIKSRAAAIHDAAMSSLEHVQYLLAHGATVHDRDFDSNTPLHFAMHAGRFDIVYFLVKQGADINALNRWLESPMSIAVHHRYWRTISWMKSQGAYD